MRKPIRTSGRRRVARAAVFALVGVLVAAAAPPVTAAGNHLRIDVRRGFGGTTRGYTPNPLTIVVEAASFFGGYIEIEAPTGTDAPARYRRPIEVPGGSRKSFTIVTPRSTVESVKALDRDGKVLHEATIPAERVLQGGEPLIGLLSADPTRWNTLEIPVTGQAAPVVPVSVELLAVGNAAIAPLSHLIVDGAVTRALSRSQRQALLAFAGNGGELIVTGSRTEDLGWLPADARAGGDLTRLRIGLGSIVVGGAGFSDETWDADSEIWRDALRPVDVNRWNRSSRNSQVSQAMRESGAFRRPGLGWLLFFILTYVAIVGPMNFMVLARVRKRELAWITIPAISILFGLGAYVAGRGFRSTEDLQGVAVRMMIAGAEVHELGLGAQSRGGGEATIRLPNGWTVEPFARIAASGSGKEVTFGSRETSTRFDLATGEVGTIVAHSASYSGRVPDAGSVEINGATSNAAVSNPLAARLEDPRVWVGTSLTFLGAPLEPGDRREAQVDLLSGNSRDLMHGFSPEFGLQSGETTEQLPPALYQRASDVVGLGAPGTAFLTGWMEMSDLPRELGVGGAKGRVLVVLPLRATLRGNSLPGGLVRTAIVATDGQLPRGEFFGDRVAVVVQGARTTTVRFTLPDGARPRDLRLTADGPNMFGEQPRFAQRHRRPPAPGDPAVGVPVPRRVSGEFEVSAFDFAAGRWRTVDATDASAVSLSRRFVSEDGQIFVRFETEFHSSLSPDVFRLQGVS